MDEALRVFVGVSDSMTFKELDSVHVASELDLTQMDSLAPLEALQETLEAGELGLQQIVSHNLVPDPGMPLVLPRSFTVLGRSLSSTAGPCRKWCIPAFSGRESN